MKKHKKKSESQPIPASFLTRQDKLAVVMDLIETKNPHLGQCLLPDENVYKTGEQGFGIESCAVLLADWLDISIVGFTFEYSDTVATGSLATDQQKPVVYISSKYRYNPYVGAAILANLLTHYKVAQNKKFLLNDQAEYAELVDLVSIYSGLGLVIANGLRYTSGWPESLLQKFTQAQQPDISYYEPKQYAEECLLYIEHYNLPLSQLAEYLAPWTRRFLPTKLKRASKDGLKRSPAAHKLDSATRHNNIALASVIGTVLVLVGGGWYFWQLRPERLSSEQVTQYAKIQKLKQQYKNCEAVVKEKQTVQDATDFFMNQSISADISRCTSLRNEYNYEVDVFNQSLGE